jgi:Fic family protein
MLRTNEEAMSVSESSLIVGYEWHPIEALGEADRQFDLADIRPLYDAWRTAKERIKKRNGDSLRQFTDRVVRSLSIETGILERLYDLDRGTTEALVTHGFVEDLVARNSTSIEPGLLIEILRDQESAIRLVMDCVASSRALTKGFLHELHATMTQHQDTTDAVDQFGRRVKIQLRRGVFKEHPNNPVRDDGAVHQYCPPVHVDAEVERLLALYAEYQASSEDPIVLAAWLHHRFTQIHPYQDGNGRLARALVTLVLLKCDLLPVVIDRNERVEYIYALEAADHRDLTSLISEFATLEKRAILQALSVETEKVFARRKSFSSEVIANLQSKLLRRRVDKDEQFRKVNVVAKALRDQSERLIIAALARLENTVQELGASQTWVTVGGPDRDNEHWYRFDVIQSAKGSGKWVNFGEAHFFVKGAIRVENLRLVFVVSEHHIGRELSGVMEATAFSWLESFDALDDHSPASKQYFVASPEPFVIAWNTDPAEVAPLFEQWLDTALAVAFKEFGDRV